MINNALKLYYFNMRGRAEVIRLILAAGNRKYEDIRFELSEWPEYKPKMLLGQVPVLKFANDTQLTQSLAIARYLAREVGLAGTNNLESAEIDTVVETQRDMNEVFYTKLVIDNVDLKPGPEFQKFIETNYVEHCDKLTTLKNAYSKNEKYFVGNNLSWADLYVYDSINSLSLFESQVIKNFNNRFKGFCNNIHNETSLKKYFEERPKTTY